MNQYERMVQALSPVIALAPLGTANRYNVHQDQLIAWLKDGARDEEWAYTVRTALEAVQSVIFFAFTDADQAIASVLEQCA